MFCSRVQSFLSSWRSSWIYSFPSWNQVVRIVHCLLGILVRYSIIHPQASCVQDSFVLVECCLVKASWFIYSYCITGCDMPHDAEDSSPHELCSGSIPQIHSCRRLIFTASYRKNFGSIFLKKWARCYFFVNKRILFVEINNLEKFVMWYDDIYCPVCYADILWQCWRNFFFSPNTTSNWNETTKIGLSYGLTFIHNSIHMVEDSLSSPNIFG